MSPSERRLATKRNARSLDATMKNILVGNGRQIARRVALAKETSIRSQIMHGGVEWRELKMPDLENIVPKVVSERSMGVRGRLITDSLRQRMADAVSAAMKEGGWKRADKVTPEKARVLRNALGGVFEKYLKRDPKMGSSSWVRAVANTEMRSIVNDLRYRYFDKLMKENRGVVVMKRWVHHPALSANPRESHAAMHGTTIGLSASYRVRSEAGTVFMAHPHDSSAGPDNNMNCHCEVQYIARRRT